jgi:hypothetical protein
MAPLVALLGACTGDLAVSPNVAPEDAVGTIAVSPGVSIIAVGQTQQLTVTALSLTNAPITLDSVVYRLNSAADTARVKLSASGVVTAIAPSTSAILVNVFGYKHGGVKADQAMLQTTATPVSGLTLSIQPPPGDSTRLAAGSTKTIAARVRNPVTGDSVLKPIVRFTVGTGDSTRVAVYIANLSSPSGTPSVIHPSSFSASAAQIRSLASEGTVWVHASITAFGTVLQDSVLYTLTYPFTQTISVGTQGNGVVSTFKDETLTLAPGATITFTNNTSNLTGFGIAISFDTPSAATAATTPSVPGGSSGNVTTLTSGQSSARRFLTAGTYHWTMLASGPAPYGGQTFSGTIVIK